MPFLPAIPDDSSLLAVLARRPAAAAALLDYHEALMRGPSDLTEGEREFIAAYVSGLNACAYCHGVHAEAARSFGVEADALGAAIDDLERAPLEQRLVALLRYVRKLVRDPGRMNAGDVAAVLEAGWSEDAVMDAVAVCGLFSLMNRTVQALGIDAPDSYKAMAGKRLREGGYAALKGLVAGAAKG